MNLDVMQEIVKQFCEKREWDQFHNPKDLAIGLSTEANELLDIFRFKTTDQMDTIMNDRVKREKVADELADIFFFLLRFSQMYNFDLCDALQCKLRKNDEKYPVELVKGNNQKYNEYSR